MCNIWNIIDYPGFLQTGRILWSGWPNQPYSCVWRFTIYLFFCFVLLGFFGGVLLWSISTSVREFAKLTKVDKEEGVYFDQELVDNNCELWGQCSRPMKLVPWSQCSWPWLKDSLKCIMLWTKSRLKLIFLYADKYKLILH